MEELEGVNYTHYQIEEELFVIEFNEQLISKEKIFEVIKRVGESQDLFYSPKEVKKSVN